MIMNSTIKMYPALMLVILSILLSIYESADAAVVRIKDNCTFQSERDAFIKVKDQSVPIEPGHPPIPLKRTGNGHIELKFQSETVTAQNLSKNPKVPSQSDDKEIK